MGLNSKKIIQGTKTKTQRLEGKTTNNPVIFWVNSECLRY